MGCQSGLITTLNVTPLAHPYAKTGAVKDPMAEEQGGRPSATTESNTTVFFLSIVSDFESTPTVKGFNFLSSGSKVVHPFGFRLSSAQAFNQLSWNPVFVEGRLQISWIEASLNGNRPHLKILDPGSLTTWDRGEVFDALNWSISSDSEWVVGIQENGKAILQNMNTQAITPLLEQDLSKEAMAFQIFSRKQVVILDPVAHRLDLFSLFEPDKILKSWKSRIFAASPLGAHFIIGDSDGIQIVETDSGHSQSVLGEITNLRFPHWKDEQTLAFISGSDGQSQLQVLDLRTSRLYPITPLSVRIKEEVLVCPAWINDSLFYADKTGPSFWSLWKVVDPFLSPPHPKLFVQPFDPGKGYLCPKGNGA
jgi:hypothetical protein